MPIDRIGVVVERQAAVERRLAEQQHAARIAVARREFAEAGDRIGIAVLAHVGENRDRDLALVELVEQLHGADDLQPLVPRDRAGGAVQIESAAARAWRAPAGRNSWSIARRPLV